MPDNNGQRHNSHQTWSAHWLFHTIVGSLFPIIILIIIHLITKGSTSIEEIIRGGEVILTSGVISWSVVGEFVEKEKCINKHKYLYYFLLLAVMIDFVAYALIRVTEEPPSNVVEITSFLTFVTSLLISWISERAIEQEG